jgi:hypothetical protein
MAASCNVTRLMPDMKVTPTINGIRSGRDEVDTGTTLTLSTRTGLVAELVYWKKP